MLYRTTDPARWGAGKGSNLEPVEIDLNFWELAERLAAAEAAVGEAANGIANIGVVGSQMTVYLAGGTALGPYTLPTAMIHYRSDWAAASVYNEMDLVTVPDAGVYLVLQDHTSDATFDALAEGVEGNPLYRFLFPMGTGGGGGASSMAQLTDVDLSEPPVDGQTLVFFGGTWYPGLPSISLGDLQGVFITDPPFSGGLADGDVLTWVAADQAWRNRPAAGGGAVSVSDEGAQVLATPSDINFAGAGVSVASDGDGTLTVTIPGESGGGATTLDGLTDVTITGPAAGQFLRYDGDGFVNAAVGWADIAGKPAAFAPSTHQHAADEIDGAAIETIPGTAYTQTAADHRKWKRTTSADPVTVTIDANVNAAEDEITFQQGGAGQITLAAGAGMTLSTSGSLVTAGLNAVVGIKFISATEATLFGHTTDEAAGGGTGDMTAAVYDPRGIKGDAFDRTKHTGEQPQTSVTGLVDALAGKAPSAHEHAQADVTGLVDALAAKADTGHGHAQADVAGLVDALAAKSDVGHGHAQADITGLVDALAGKAPMAHSHPVEDIQATGTRSATTFLRGDGAWETPAGGGGGEFSGSWQDFTADRSASTVYQNTTGKQIGVHIHASTSIGRDFQTSPDNVTWGRAGFIQNGSPTIPQTTFVPAGHYYRINGSVSSIAAWWELR